MTYREQPVIDPDAPSFRRIAARDSLHEPADGACARDGERAARHSLRAQIGKLERELSAIVAETFPYIAAPRAEGSGCKLPACSAWRSSSARATVSPGDCRSCAGSPPSAGSTSGEHASSWSG